MKRIAWTVAAFTLATGFSAHAIELQTPVTKQLYTCDMPGVSRVAVRTGPAPCCDGQLKCAELLATSGVLQGKKRLGRT